LHFTCLGKVEPQRELHTLHSQQVVRATPADPSYEPQTGELLPSFGFASKSTIADPAKCPGPEKKYPEPWISTPIVFIYLAIRV
jgi:hypothetical protein